MNEIVDVTERYSYLSFITLFLECIQLAAATGGVIGIILRIRKVENIQNEWLCFFPFGFQQINPVQAHCDENRVNIIVNWRFEQINSKNIVHVVFMWKIKRNMNASLRCDVKKPDHPYEGASFLKRWTFW